MHPRNQMRLLAGLTIDPALETRQLTEARLTEAREVPNRKSVSPANEANLKKKLANCEKACQHMRNAVKALEAAPATDTDAKIPQMIQDVEALCDELADLCKAIGKTKPLKEAKAKPDYIDADDDGDKKESMKKAVKDKKKVEEGSAYPGCENEEESKAYSKGKKKFPGEEKCEGNKANKKCDDVTESHVDKDKDKTVKDKSGKVWTVLSSGKGEGDEEVYKLECPKSGKKASKKASELLDESSAVGGRFEPVKPETLGQEGTYVAYGYYDDHANSVYRRLVVHANSPEEAAELMDARMKRHAKASKSSMRHSKVKQIRDANNEKVLWDAKGMSESYGEYEEERPEKFKTANDFKKGEKVMYDNGIWLVHVTDAEADLVGIIPPSMRNASKDEQAKAMQQVKRDKIRKPDEEECEVMAGPDGIVGTADDGQMGMRESTLNYTQSNVVSHEDEEEDPVSVVGQSKGQWANSLNPETVKNEFTTQLDQRGDQSMDDYANKAKVPAKVKSALKDAISEFEKDAKKFGRSGSDMETKQFYLDAGEAFQQLLDHLNAGTIMDVKKAQQFASSLMGPMLHKIPDVVWDFITNGGQKRSLKDYMNKVDKFPIEGPRNSE